MWQVVFWVSVGAIVYSYFGYPIVLFIVTKLRKKEPLDFRQGFYPSLCLFISAFNEEKVIRKKIENSLGLVYPRDKYTILIASDGSTDRTVEVVKEYADHGVVLHHRGERRGKSATINEVVRKIKAEVVVFTDANSLFSREALIELAKYFADSRIGCVVGKLKYVKKHTSCVGKGEGIYWRYESRISVLESVLRSVLVANGSIFAIRKDLFQDLYPEVANDFQLPIEIASRGYGVVYEPRAVAIERSTVLWKEEFERKVRIVLRGITGFSMLSDRFRGFRLWQFVSHKLLRWAVAPFLLGVFLSNALLWSVALFYKVVFVFQCLFYAAALNGWRVRKARTANRLFYIPFYFTMVNLAASVAIVKFLGGRRQSVWDKAESARFSLGASLEDNVFVKEKQGLEELPEDSESLKSIIGAAKK